MHHPISMIAALIAALFAGIAPPARGQDSEKATAPSTGAASAGKPLKVKMEMRDGLRFDPPRFSAQPGQEIIVSLENTDTTHQPHNFLVLQPGKREAIVQQALALGEKGPAVDFIPANPDIIVHSALLNPDGKTEVRFTAPMEKGIYPYICTMPGHGLVMYGALYVGLKPPLLAADKNIPPQAAQNAIPGGGERPYVQRTFLPNTGPASIAVALPGEQNYCWDAGECRLRYVWRGSFIDASGNWRGNGNELAVVPEKPWWTAERDTFSLRFGESGSPLPAKFLGYKLDGGLPEFHYRVGAVEVFEKITSLPDNTGIVEHFRIPKASQPVKFSVAPGMASIEGDAPKSGTTIAPANPKDFTITFKMPPSPTAAAAKP